jgi:hypothetical protein
MVLICLGKCQNLCIWVILLCPILLCQLLGLGFSEEDAVQIEGYNFKSLMLIQIVMISSFSIQHTVCSGREEQCEKHILKQITYLLCHILLYCVMSSSICSL